MSTLLQLEKVSVRYRMNSSGQHSIKDFFTTWSNPFATKQILNEISFDVPTGTSLGILGRNGSGKSTLLRTIAGIIKPSHGKLIVNGSLAPILALGAGLELELTGHENIQLLLALFGKQIKSETIEEITSFSELDEKTLRQPVKCYSSGMVARLAFSISFSQSCDIYIIDEVMAVGDMGFQTKCMDRINALQKAGKTFLFVSHFPDEVERICDRAILLEQGNLILHGTAAEVCQEYKRLF